MTTKTCYTESVTTDQGDEAMTSSTKTLKVCGTIGYLAGTAQIAEDAAGAKLTALNADSTNWDTMEELVAQMKARTDEENETIANLCTASAVAQKIIADLKVLAGDGGIGRDNGQVATVTVSLMAGTTIAELVTEEKGAAISKAWAKAVYNA